MKEIYRARCSKRMQLMHSQKPLVLHEIHLIDSYCGTYFLQLLDSSIDYVVEMIVANNPKYTSYDAYVGR